MFVVYLCLKIIFRRFTPNIRKGLICLNLGTYSHVRPPDPLTRGSASGPRWGVGALPPDLRYSLALCARHGLQPPKVKFLVTSLRINVLTISILCSCRTVGYVSCYSWASCNISGDSATQRRQCGLRPQLEWLQKRIWKAGQRFLARFARWSFMFISCWRLPLPASMFILRI